MAIRRPMMAANWKMNKLVGEAERYMEELLPRVSGAEGVEVAIFAPFTSLANVARMAQGSGVLAGAQNFYYEDSGAYTGEVSAPMLKDVGAGAVIVGHSERRELFGETDELVARKARKALQEGLLPVVCIGEMKEERDGGRFWEKISTQVRRVVEELDGYEGDELVFAYEPIWAIGTGETATPEDAQDAMGRIRGLLAELLGEDAAGRTRILYGGSMKPENVAELLRGEDVDGGLVGGASLDAGSFAELVDAARESTGVRGI